MKNLNLQLKLSTFFGLGIVMTLLSVWGALGILFLMTIIGLSKK